MSPTIDRKQKSIPSSVLASLGHLPPREGECASSSRCSKKHNMKTTSILKPNSQILRKAMTKEERHLWYDFLKRMPCTVNRQKVIGKYIVDFYIDSANLVIEIDGSQHYESEGTFADQKRDAVLGGIGLTVLRYSNAGVNQRFDSVREDILNHIEMSRQRLPSGEAVTAQAVTDEGKRGF